MAEVKVELTSVKRKQSGRFIPPIPLPWFKRACKLKGKACLVAAVLWYRSKLAGSDTVVLSQALLGEFGVSRQAKYRALDALEGGGLVRVNRRPRRNPEVTILAPRDEGE